MFFVTSPVMAGDAYDGEFFGYKLGEKYPVTDKTQKFVSFLGLWEIVPEHPVKPDEMKKALVLATAKTFTIVAIQTATKFDTKKEAEAFINRYLDLLLTRYNKGKIRPISRHYREVDRLKLELSKKYLLEIGYYGLDERKPKHKVYISLRACCTLTKTFKALTRKEIDNYLGGRSTERLKSARKKGLLKGLE